MGTTTAITVKVHPGTAPTTLLEFHQHNNLDALPDFDEDNKVLALEYNAWVTRIKAMAEAQRTNSILVGQAPATSAVAHLLSVLYDGVVAANGIPRVSIGGATVLNKAFQMGVASLTDGLTLSAVGSASNFFIQVQGVISASTAFPTGTLLGISSDGSLITFAAGQLPPVGFIAIAGKSIYVAGGRVFADGVSVRFNGSGALEVLAAGIDHGGLAGLGDDDHTQYSLVDGTRAFTGTVGGITPAAASDLATKSYVDNQIDGKDWKESVRFATVVAGTLATDFENGDTVDGGVLVTGDRIHIKNQVAGIENGLYTINASGAPTRADDYLTGSSAANTVIIAEEGTLNADLAFQCTNDVGSDVVGTDALVYIQFNPGESNTASNQGVGGVGVFDNKNGIDLEFRNVTAASGKITVTLDAGNKEIDIDAVPTELEFILANRIFG